MPSGTMLMTANSPWGQWKSAKNIDETITAQTTPFRSLRTRKA